jgi:carotenoid 1,2-hydratase
MTERGAGRLRRDASALNIGPSTVAWTGDSVSLRIDEVCAPVPRRIRGRITLRPTALGSRCFSLDPAGRHRWTPFAPCAHVSVDLDEPALRWTGAAYLDSNAGDEPLEAAFRRWTWSRAGVADGTVVLYDVTRRGATAGRDQAAGMALHFAADGRHEPVELPPVVRLPSTGWRIARTTRAEAGHTAHVVDTLEDAPFYSRSVLQTRLLGSNAAAIHESLDLDRFDSRWVQCLLPFRMPRKSF